MPFLGIAGFGGGISSRLIGLLIPVYSVSPSTASVNEGSSVTFTVTTTNVPNGTTLYWSLNTVSGTVNTSDFTGAAVTGSFTITSGSGSVALTLANDVTTEGSESFQLQVRTGSTSGTIVATSSTVTIGDTSLTITGYSFNLAKIYSVYDGGARSANYTVQYSNDNSNWSTAWTGTMSTNGCGLITGSGGGGNYGKHPYWRYTNNDGAGSHHPRMSRIVLSDGTTNVTIQTFTSDNCGDSGTIPSNGTTYTYTDTTYSA